MDDRKELHVIFDPVESRLYEIVLEHCTSRGIDVSDYIKDVIKKDLAWGHFARRKRTRGRGGNP
jgi:hypothetical protein